MRELLLLSKRYPDGSPSKVIDSTAEQEEVLRVPERIAKRWS